MCEWIIETIKYFRGKGCPRCRNTGYFGRIAILELFIINEKVRTLIPDAYKSEEIEQVAIQNGMRLLIFDGWSKVFKGITTIEEVMRVMNIL